MEEVKDISPWAAALMTAGGNILANNRPGVSYGNAIGSGISSFAPAFYATKGAQDRQRYIDTLQKYKQLEFDAEQQKAQQEAAQKARFNSAIQSGEAFQGMPQDQVETINRAYKIGGDELARKVFETYSTREPNKPTEFEYFLNPETRPAMLAYKRAGATTVSNDIRLPDNVQIGKIDPGYLLRRQGDSMWMEPIPGSAVDREIKESEVKKARLGAAAEVEGDLVNKAVESIRQEKDKSLLPVTGAAGELLSNVGGTSAANVRNDIEFLKDRISLRSLNEMRQNSPTGAGVGDVTEGEGDRLASAYGKLSQSVGTEKFDENLVNFEQSYNQIVHNKNPDGSRYKTFPGMEQNITSDKKEQKQRFVFDPATGELVPK